MKTRNITPFLRYGGALMWIVAASVAAPLLLPAGINLIAGVVVGVAGAHAIMWLFAGDRVWLTSGRVLPIKIMVKPRGFTTSSGLGGRGSGDDEVTCKGCGNDFEEVNDHFRSDSDHYCPDCSRVGELVMNNYQQWFSTTEEVRHAESAD